MNERIAGRQFAILVYFYTIGTSILTTPAIIAIDSKQSAWISILLTFGGGCLLVWLYNTLGSKFPDRTVAEYGEIILGKWGGKLASILLFYSVFLLSAIMLRTMGEFITIHLMPETPIQSTVLLFLIVTVIGARAGIETIGRTAELLFPWFLLLFIIFTLLISPNFDFKQLLPIDGVGIKAIVRGTIRHGFFPYSELVALLMVFPHVNSAAKAKKALRNGMLLGSVVLFMVTVMSILVLGAESTAKYFFPSFIMAKRINIAGFLQRIEVIMAIMWFITIFFKLVLLFYGSVIILMQMLKLNDYRSLTFPLGLILYVASFIISPNTVQLLVTSRIFGFPFNLTYGFLLPLILLITAKARKL